MPKKGYTVITIDERAYLKLKEMMIELNKLAEFRKFRSVSQLIEAAVTEYYAENTKQKCENVQ